MHELSIAQALLDQVEAIAAERAASRIPAITIRVGPLSGVEPELLRRAFEVARLRNPVTADSLLTIETVGIRIRCGDCGNDGPGQINHLACRQCGSRCTRLLQGDELLLMQVECELFETPETAKEAERGDCHV